MRPPEQQPAPGVSSLSALGTFLQDARRVAGLSYRQMESKANYSHATLQRACRARDLPSLQVVLAIAHACGADPDDAQRLWITAGGQVPTERAPSSGLGRDPVSSQALRNVATPHEFSRELRRLKTQAQNPSIREIAKRSGLSPSTIHEALREDRQRVPPLDVVTAIVTALGVVDNSELDEWHQARTRTASVGSMRRDSFARGSDFAEQANAVGLNAVYPNRALALAAFQPVLERELAHGPNGRLWIVASSMKGLLQIRALSGSGALGQAFKAGCDVRILCTTPDKVDERAKQEGRPYGAIWQEMLLNLRDLRLAGLRQDQLRHCTGAPTVFAICTHQHMLLNPYPFGNEAYLNVSFIFRQSASADSVFDRYLDSHFLKAWNNGPEIDATEWAWYDPTAAMTASRRGDEVLSPGSEGVPLTPRP